jgi:hypothetical protein
MEALYQDIAVSLHAACPPGYRSAWIDAEVGDDWDDQTLWCEDASGRQQPELEISASFKVGRSLRKIRDQMTVPGQKPWSKCTFTLFPDGTFKFDVDYDD